MDIAPVDPQKHLQEDMDGVAGASPLRMGITRRVEMTSDEMLSFHSDTVGSEVVSTVRFRSPRATFLSFRFSGFDLPKGAQLFFYDVEQKNVLGAFTKDNRQPDGTFYTQAIPGEECYMEFRCPVESV